MTDREAIHEKIADDLHEKGWSVQTDYFPAALSAALMADMEAQAAAGKMAQAAIGRGAEGAIDQGVRNDRTLWLSKQEDAPRRYLALMEELRIDLNRRLFMGLFEFEAHYALYPAGGFYKKHLDSLHGSRNRIISTVSYLTPEWIADWGGHLVLYDPVDDTREMTRVLPLAGTLALFLSEDIPHEVLPPLRPRASIAGWYRCNGSGEDRVDPGA